MPEQKKQDFSCPECAAEFTTKEELDGHNEKVHGEQSGTQKPPQPRKKTA